MPAEELAISRSEMETFARDPRWWYLTWYLQYQPAFQPPTGALNLGSRVHLAMQAKYGYDLDPLLVLDVLYAAEIEASGEYEKELRKEWELSRIMVEGYLEEAAAQGWDSHLKVIATEQEVCVPLPGVPGVSLRVKLDQAVQDLDTGVLSFLDWKTGIDFAAAEYAREDPQMRLYSLVQWLAAGHPDPPAAPLADRPAVLGGIVTVLKKVKRTKTAQPPFYRRESFVHSPEIMQATLRRCQYLAGEIIRARSMLAMAGSDLDAVNQIQQGQLRRVWITGDCSWRCPHSKGMCQLMDRGGSGWAEALVSGGGYVQGDPYAYYADDGIERVKALLEKRAE